ncbi:MAG TPA: general stress protein [Thermoleophilaceae bacterium]|nr:general stress protein [Thermoleophilaceae bacterium]
MNPEAATRNEEGLAIASFRTYAEAEAAVDRLSDSGFPVDRVAIVGRGLRLVERVTGRLGYGEATLRGAAAGAFAGALIGWLFAVFDWLDPLVPSGWLIVDGFLVGSLAGASIGLLMHALTGGRRDFTSIPSVEADRYDLVVDEPFADEAAALLNHDPATA